MCLTIYFENTLVTIGIPEIELLVTWSHLQGTLNWWPDDVFLVRFGPIGIALALALGQHWRHLQGSLN